MVMVMVLVMVVVMVLLLLLLLLLVLALALALVLALVLALALGGAVVHGFGCAPVPLLRRAAWWRGVSLWCLGLSAFGVGKWE